MGLNLNDIKNYLREQPWLGSKRTHAAQAVLFLGWSIILLSVLCYLVGIELPRVMGASAVTASLFLGAMLVLMVYLSEIIGLAMVLFSMWFLKSSGISPEGFSFWNVAAKNWLLTAIYLTIGIVVWKVFRQRREKKSKMSAFRPKNLFNKIGGQRKKGGSHSRPHSEASKPSQHHSVRLDHDDIFEYSLYLILGAFIMMYFEIDNRIFDYKIVYLMIGIGAITSIGALAGKDAKFVLGGIGLILLFYNSGTGCNLFETSWKAWIMAGFCFWMGYYISRQPDKI